jgi:hypothetical protein
MISIIDWFDVKNFDHIRAYKHLQYTGGFWPEGFIPDNVEMVLNWQFLLIAKLAQEYLNQF